jgi:hypothetical protein
MRLRRLCSYRASDNPPPPPLYCLHNQHYHLVCGLQEPSLEVFGLGVHKSVVKVVLSISLIKTRGENATSLFRDVAHYFLHVSSGSVFQPRHVSQRKEPLDKGTSTCSSFPSSRSSSRFLRSERNFVIDHRIDKVFCTKFQRNLGGVVFGGNQRANFRRLLVSFVVFFLFVC